MEVSQPNDSETSNKLAQEHAGNGQRSNSAGHFDSFEAAWTYEKRRSSNGNTASSSSGSTAGSSTASRRLFFFFLPFFLLFFFFFEAFLAVLTTFLLVFSSPPLFLAVAVDLAALAFPSPSLSESDDHGLDSEASFPSDESVLMTVVEGAVTKGTVPAGTVPVGTPTLRVFQKSVFT